MSRYIDADCLLAKVPQASADIFENCRNCTCLDSDQIKELIDAEPTADVAEVVRCRDCLYHEYEEVGMVYCATPVGGWVNDNWFCADGEKIVTEDAEQI